MKLLGTQTSPFVRKVRVLLSHYGLTQVAFEVVHPVDDDARVRQHNPLGKIPVLAMDDGRAIFDSRVICEYIDRTLGNRQFYPGGQRGDEARHYEALGDGIMDAALFARMEALRPADKRMAPQRALAAIRAAVSRVDPLALAEPWHIGHVAVGCALGYLDFRHSDLEWRQWTPDLAQWYAQIVTTAAFQATSHR